ncbi:6367_t:CDS:2 [Diversispora eburnea]|uniref:6367_t:CDS:1 n=1 Tax=Diversispora eburnea TaxID=1213867 RepID=A0A9N9AFN7_9GLOM|nr:6367_t:CDS:2 [Diversispora eburnea]
MKMKYNQINLFVALTLSITTTQTFILLAISADPDNTQPDYSASCSEALYKLYYADFELNNCFPILNVSEALQSNNTDPEFYRPTLDNLCKYTKCTEKVITERRKTFQSACQEDIQKKKSNIISIENLLLLYSPSYDSSCFKNSTNGYCLLELWYSEIKYNTTRSSPGFNPQDGITPMTSLPKDSLCTDCNRKITNAFIKYLNENPEIDANLTAWDPQELNKTLTSKCDDTFIDKQTTTSTPSSTGSNIDDLANPLFRGVSEKGCTV